LDWVPLQLFTGRNRPPALHPSKHIHHFSLTGKAAQGKDCAFTDLAVLSSGVHRQRQVHDSDDARCEVVADQEVAQDLVALERTEKTGDPA